MSNPATLRSCVNRFKLVTTPAYSWTIQYGDSVCNLPRGLKGLEYVHHILSGGGVPGAALVESVPDELRALPIREIKQTIDELNGEAKAALSSGNKPRYDELMAQVIVAQKYLRETTGLGNRSRWFPDEQSRVTDAVRKAISRAIEAIRKQAPTIADHLSSTISDADGEWLYGDPDSQWDTATDHLEICGLDDESETAWSLTPPAEDPEVLALRQAWSVGKIAPRAVRAAIENFRQRTGLMEEDRDLIFEHKLEQWEKIGDTEPTESVAHLAKQSLERNRRRYAGRGEDFILEQTRLEVRNLINAQVWRKHAPKSAPWWSV